jgi:hypothetical protein
VAFLRAVPVFLALALGQAFAQASSEAARAETVAWSAPTVTAAKPGGKAQLTLNGTVLAGWHVYSLKQALEGPTPLLVTVDANDIAAADGAVSESPATTFKDPAFGVDTHYYSNAFSLTVPVRLKGKPGAGQAIPVSVRFQTCNGRICQPPKTVHLSAPVNLAGG